MNMLECLNAWNIALPLLETVCSVAPVTRVVEATLVTQAWQGVPGGAARAGGRSAAPPVRVPVPRGSRRLADAWRTPRCTHETV